jgi:trimeric autotransporter adhesin
MKKTLLTSVFIIAAIVSFCQVPNGFNYQAVLRNSSGDIISIQSVDIEISIIDENSGGTVLYTETHTKTTNAYGLVNLVIGSETPDYGEFTDIDWAVNDKFINVKVDATDMGTFQLLTVPFAMHAASATNLGSENVYTGTDTLFVVKDAEGNPVFVVFPDGAKVIVEEATKGRVGGFAVSGRSPTKAEETEIFHVTPDSTRIFVNDSVSAKGRVGGFAVSGRSPTKKLKSDYLVITPDSTRIYVNDSTLSKGRVGGFAVSGRSPTKNGSIKFMDMTKDNYFIGHLSGQQNGDGLYNSFLGYESGKSNVSGSNNSFIGHRTGYSNQNGNSNTFFGDSCGFNNIDGSGNMFIGKNAGRANENGSYNSFMGTSSGASNYGGLGNSFIGSFAGYASTIGNYNSMIGDSVGYFNTTGSYNAYLGAKAGFSNNGNKNIMIGYQSGYSSSLTDSCVFIGNVSGFNNNFGHANVYIGDHSGYTSSSGNGNTFIGAMAGNKTINSYMTAVGHKALSEASSIHNSTAVGHMAGYGASGAYNLYLGDYAGKNSSGFWNVFIGWEVGKNVSGNSLLYIDRESTSTPLIYGDFSANDVVINGDLYYTGALAPYSDKRLKTSLESIKGGLETINKLKSYYFYWNEKAQKELAFTSRKQIGFIAQEVEVFLPELVTNDSKGYKSVDYLKVVPLVVEAIKEQQSIIESQEQKINKLEKRISEIERLLQQNN